MCNILKVSKSGYYAWFKRNSNPKELSKFNKLEVLIKTIFKESYKTYGARRIKKKLEELGIIVSRKTIRKIMLENNLINVYRKKYKATTNSNHKYPVAPNILNQEFKASSPNQIWVTDITYIKTKEGWLYLASIIDLYSKKIVGWALDKRMTTDLVISALEQAVNKEKPNRGLIHHSDRGVQYASYAYREELEKYGMLQSMSRKGNCYDNACAESFFSTLKIELIHTKEYETRKEAKSDIVRYIELFYNSKRLHSSIGYKTPNNFENEYYLKEKVA